MPETPHLVLQLLEPPTLNTMLRLAKQKTRRGPGGVWMRSAQSKYWVTQQDYQAAVRAEVERALAFGRAAVALPPRPWPRWHIVAAHYRVHQLWDPLELPAGLKWAADALVAAAFVANDSPRELAPPPSPTQEVARRARGVTLTIGAGWPEDGGR